MNDDEPLAELLGNFASCLVGKRRMANLYMLLGLHTRFVRTLSPDEKHQQAEIESFKMALRLYKLFLSNPQKLPGLEKIEARSVFKTVAYEQLVALCEESKWKSSTAIQHHSQQSNRRLVGSQLCEDGFNRQKTTKTLQNKRVKKQSAYFL